MKTVYVKKRSDLTVIKDKHEAENCQVYRTRLGCGCRYPFNFRYGVLVVVNDCITQQAIRCKACVKTEAL